jgi:pimeloyl-ACP methyl ester carboxylesterase
MNATLLDTASLFSQAASLRIARARQSRKDVSYLRTAGGNVRCRMIPCGSSSAPRILLACDGPNVIEHYDDLVAALSGKADLCIFEPPGTGGSAPARDFDFTLNALTQSCAQVLEAVGLRTLVFPCYLGFVGQTLARAVPQRVNRLVMPQTSSWSDLVRWADVVDARRLLRTPVVGQAVVRVRRRKFASAWYRASTGHRRFRAPFTAAADEAFDFGGCFCLASLMQGLERTVAPQPEPVPVPAAVIWGAQDRTHRHSQPQTALPGAEVVRFDACGHSPELEDPNRFAQWLLAWERP